MATASDLQQLYVGYFGRAADQEGLNFWLEAINNGGLSLDNVHASFVQSEEYQAQYEGLSSNDLVAQVYMNVLGRPAEAEGLAFWAGALDAGSITEDQLIEGILSGLSPRDALIISNKVTVANYYTAVRGAEYNEADKVASGDIIAGVDGDVESVAIALQDIADNVEGPGASNDELAAALLNLEAAQEAQLAYARSYLDDEAGTVLGAQGDIADAVSDAQDAVNDAIGDLNVTTAAITFGTDSASVVQTKLNDATTNAARAVTNAQTAVNAETGLNAAATAYARTLTAFDAADDAYDAAVVTQNAELASFNVNNGGAPLTVNANGTVGTVGTTEVLVLNNGQLSVSSTYLNADGRTEAQKTAAQNLLADVQARLAAEDVRDDALTAVTNAADRVDTLDGTTTIAADGYTLTAGLVATLVEARAEQVALAEAIADLNEANAVAAEFAELDEAITDAGTAIADLGFDLVSVANGAVVADNVGDPAEDEVFIFAGTDATGAAVIADFSGDDVLFVGTGYVQGTDSDLTTGIQGGNNAALEVFFTQSGANVVVSIETSEFGSNAATPEFHAITLTGVTVDELSFDANTGFVSVA